ncbi:MAG: leucine--tRNA ligase [Candidatus Zixiibacteriota bacterium]|nr:MAG: leucine--tRNA ligase [candidate division Zixibacteria bacterium]
MSETKQNIAPSYPFERIDSKWRRYWEDTRFHETDLSRYHNKLYSLVMFSYPSGDKLHVGHSYAFALPDTWTRKKRMEGYNTFEPMGYDSFGLPAENYAIKTGIHPRVSIAENIQYIRKQLKEMGAMLDWSKELATSDPRYYKWTQWLFLKFFEEGMAVRKIAPVNWCPSCNTVLANEQVVDGSCERCETEIIRKNLRQWFFRITEYSDRLLEGLDKIDWPERTKTMQRNWIGRSEGTEIVFTEENTGEKIPVFTTRADTLFGVSYLVLAPEHPLVESVTTPDNRSEVDDYIYQASKLSEIDRQSTVKEKTGVFTGSYCINPINGDRVPIWIADYVLVSYGTGGVMAVPGHDQRDWEFATKFNLEIREVIKPTGGLKSDLNKGAFENYGIMINSAEFSGLNSKEGMKKVTEKLKSINSGDFKITFKLRDWLISRQRYWGPPIPIIFCPKCGEVPVPENELPVLLPDIDDFMPTGDGRSPLAKSEEFVKTDCPKCGGKAERETETMDTFVDSSWYFLRYLDPDYEKGPWNPELAKKWLPVDMYIGGAEQAVMHLLYARFFCMFLNDYGLLHFDEPFLKLRHQGTITRAGAKISKSKGNIVNPDEFIELYGSDTFRMYLMFMGSYSLGGDWDDTGIIGIARFLNRIYRIIEKHSKSLKKYMSSKYAGIENKNPDLDYRLNLTIKRVSEDIESLEFNTAVAALMELLNDLYKVDEQNAMESELFYYSLKTLILLIAPMAPHLGEELWEMAGGNPSVFNQKWPEYDRSALDLDKITMVIQINGKLRGSFNVAAGMSEESLFELALKEEKISKHLGGKKVVKKIFVPGKLLNIVVK